MVSKQSRDHETYVRSYAICDFANQHHFDHHQLHSTSLIISLHSTKNLFKIQKYFSFGHLIKHLAGRVKFEAHAENWSWTRSNPALSAALEHPLTLLHQCHHLPAPPLDQSDKGMTMPWHGMATPCHLPHLSSPACTTMSSRRLSLS